MAKILVADDVKSMRDLLRQLLENDGHKVREVATGKAVVEALEGDESFDLILLDIGMPGLDGIATMKKITAMEGEKPKVCFVTGEKDQKTVVEAIKAGGKDFIVKPIDIVVFRNKLASLVGGTDVKVMSIKTNLRMEIPEFPIAVDLTMTELSELGLTLISSVTFKENSTIQLVSPTFNGILGEEFRFPCVIKSITEHKKTHQFEIKCSFVGLHDNNRQKIRNQTMKGHEISDKIDPGSQAS